MAAGEKFVRVIVVWGKIIAAKIFRVIFHGPRIIAGGSRPKFLGYNLHMVKILSLAAAGKKFLGVISIW